MRITIELPDELHGAAMAIARDAGAQFNDVLVDLMRRGLYLPVRGQVGAPGSVWVDPSSGLPRVRSAQAIGPDDIRALDDEP